MDGRMRISRIEVAGLFGVFDHAIPLNLDERTTIILGPNGVGKTVLLKLVDGLFNSRMAPIRRYPFERFSISFDDDSFLAVTKEPPRRRRPEAKNGPAELDIFLTFGRGTTAEDRFRLPAPNLEASWTSYVDAVVPELERVAARRWRNVLTGELLGPTEVFDRFAAQIASAFPEAAQPPEWLDRLRESVQVRLVDTERLRPPTAMSRRERERLRSRGESDPDAPAVVAYSRELSGSIQATLAESATLSQSLDRTFPARVVSGDTSALLSDKKLRQELNRLEKRRAALRDAGLLDKETDTPFQVPQEIDEHARAILSVYVDDVNQKLAVFDMLAARTDLLTRILNSRFRYKKLQIGRDQGIRIVTDSGQDLDITTLSSGEQHEIVLLYELLFRVEPDALVLVDEPELSLHVAWQAAFLEDLQEVARLGQFDVLLATHSPQIIGDRWDLTIELRGRQELDTANRGNHRQ